MVQGGDPTGTGNGGESIYGGAFIDEFHSRLRFNHRGLLAMANENKPNSNHSQFFFTLDACDFLDKKHTIFGKVRRVERRRTVRLKVTGNTIFNMLSVGDLETNEQDRPIHPPRLLSVEVLWNPFEDIVSRAVKRDEMSSANDSQEKNKQKRKATKDLKLLSFGDDEEAFQEEIAGSAKTLKKKAKTMMSSHDLLGDQKLKAEVDAKVLQKVAETNGAATSEDKKARAREKLKAAVAAASNKTDSSEKGRDASNNLDTTNGDKFSASSSRQKIDREEYAKLREELRKSKKAVPLLMGEEAKKLDEGRAFQDMLTPLQQQRQKYLQRKKSSKRSTREQETLMKLKRFQTTLISVNSKNTNLANDADAKSDETKTDIIESYHGQILENDDEHDDTNDDKSWMTAKLKFKKHIDVSYSHCIGVSGSLCYKTVLTVLYRLRIPQDQFRSGHDPSADDYMTIDSRNKREQRSSGDSRRNRSQDRSRGSRRP
uniref:PPIase cyclophilin-type domain-containing protein n=1 Tax=Hyaloperonospora arabidopsidis (strain Emoy2) TaxID=559515 RepID=M4C143_HYAAE